MPLRKLLSKWHLRFKDAQEEDEYNQVRLPLLTDFSRYIFLALTGLLIPYSVRYFIKDVFPQNYIIIALILGGVIVFFLTRRFKKYMELILISYMILILSLFTTVFKDLLPSSDSREAFYMGYAFAMIHRLIGYRVVKFQFVLLLYIFSIAIKFPMLPNPDTVLTIIIVVLDLLTVLLSLKSERVERALFDNLYKSKKDIMKFKQLITQYLPNQMAIFASDYSETYYINNSFKRSFKCQNTSQVKEAIERYVLEKETIAKHKNFFTSIGCLPKDDDTIITLSYFINCVSQNLHVLQDIGIFSFPVIEDPKNDILQLDENQIKPEFSDQKTSQKNSGAVAIDMNESYRSSDRGTSKSHSSDFQLEEGMKRVYRVKMFPLEWDETDAIAMVLDDITQQKVIMELKIADKNKDLVIAMVSHELRTPLNGMLGLIDIARKNLYQTDVVSYLNACKNNGVLMLNLINSILDMNQVRNNKLRLVYSKISIRDFLNETKCLFDYFCLIKNLTLNMEVDPKVPKWLTTDKNRLSQILVNLLGNAFKFTFKGGVTVRVTLESAEPCRLKMSVEDTGIGIKKEDQDRLFKMYGKLEQQDKNINTNGVGLGLTISNMLAMLLNPLDNRRIQVESEVGKGTSFSFVILSQTTESMSKQEGELTLPDTSSHVGNDDKESNLLKKMSIYTINNKENYSKLISSRQNIESRKSIFAEKPAISYSSREAIALTEPNSEDDSTLKLMKSASLKKENSQYTKKDQNNMKIEVQYQKIEEEKDQDLEFDKTSERPWCLVVDDNPFNLMVACHIMEEKGYLVKTGLNGEEAIQRVLEHQKEGKRFKVVLMDCQMPIMDGYEATRRIREMMKAGEIDEYPIVALTANNRDEEHDKLCEEVGMSGHVSKPLQVDELEGMLKLVQK